MLHCGKMGLAQQAEYYRRGRIWLARAIAADEQRQYQQAVKYYEYCCENFLAGLAHDGIPKSRRKVIKAVQEYLSRAEYLVEATGERKKQKGVQGQASSSSSSSRSRSQTTGADENGPASEQYEQNARESARKEGFASVAGMKNVKQALQEAVILPMLHPQAFKGGRKPWKGVMLYGPPGTGKSHVAAALSKEAGCNFYSLSASDIISKHQGESERTVRDLFLLARKRKPCVIFIDEIDSIGRTRDGSEGQGSNDSQRRVLTELLKQMDGVGSDLDGVTIVAATNHPFDLDPALRRRFEKRIYVPMPGPKARAKILRLNLGNDPDVNTLSKKEIDKIAKDLGAGYSGSDLANVANEALMIPVRKCLKATHFKYVPVPASRGTNPAGEGLWNGVIGFLSGVFAGPGAEDVLVPCSAWEPGAQRMSMLDPNFPSERLRVPPITMDDLKAAFRKVKPTVSMDSLHDYGKFAKSFGERNGIKDFVDDDEEEEEEEEEVGKRNAAQSSSSSQYQQQQSHERQLVPG